MSQQVDIAKAREIHAATTQGEWEAVPCEIGPTQYDGIYVGSEMICETYAVRSGDANKHDTEFIAFAHNNWKAILDAIERRAKELEISNEYIAAVRQQSDTCVAIIEGESAREAEIARLREKLHEIASLGGVDGENIRSGRWVRESELADILKRGAK